MMRLVCMVLVGVALLFGSRDVMAQACTVSAPDVFFGNVPVPVAQVDVNLPINITCSGTPNTNLRLCVGIQPSGSPRSMGNPAPSLPYELYSDPGRFQVWDDTDAGRVQVTVPLGAGGSGSVNPNVYARMFSDGSPVAGMYRSGPGDDIVVGTIKPGNSNCGSGGNTGTFSGDAFDVSVFVGGNCTITADPIDFGTVLGSIGAAIDVSGAVHASCNNELPYSIALNAGQVPGNTIANRRLGLDGSGPGVIDYQLYLDAGRSQLWGDGTVGAVYNGSGNGTTQDIPVHGRVPVQTVPVGGTYQDTVTATITF